MLESRQIELPGCLNLREVGGYVTVSGRMLARGRLYRSGTLAGVRADAASHLVRALDIRRVIDLRTSAELAEHGAAKLPLPCDHLHYPLFETIRPHWAAPGDRSPDATAGRYLEMLDAGAPTLVRLLHTLGDVHLHPTVIHCAAGRDRTGIVIACLLGILGVPDEVIAADYALSDGLVDDGGGADPETLHCLLARIRQEYGSTREFLLARNASAELFDRLSVALLTG